MRNIVLQWPADTVVIKPHSKTVVLPSVGESMGQQSDARIASDWICLLRRIPYSSKYPNAAERLATNKFLSDRLRVLLY